MDPDVGDLPNGDVLVEDGKIVEIGRGLERPDAEVVDATGMIAMPGFVDTHRHTLADTRSRRAAVLHPRPLLRRHARQRRRPLSARGRPHRQLRRCARGLNAGITTLLDWSHINNTPDHSDAAIQGLKDAGIRAIYAHGVPTGGEWWAFSELEHPEDIRRIRDTYFSSDDGLITLALAARAPGNSNFEVAKHDWELARDIGARISVHVGMRLTDIHVTHVKNISDLGLLGDDTTYIHCTDSTDEELDLIAESGGTASIAPYVEMLMGHGPPPTGRLIDRGVRPSLSVDVVSSVPGEMFTQMRTALVAERIGAFTDTPDVAFAPTLTHRDVLEFATIDGARRARSRTRSARSRPGKQADIVLLNTNAINTSPMLDPVATIVAFADTSNVDSVFVAGRAVKRNGELVDANLDNIFGTLEESRNHILVARRAAAGLGGRAGGGRLELSSPGPGPPPGAGPARERSQKHGRWNRRRRGRNAGARARGRTALRRRGPPGRRDRPRAGGGGHLRLGDRRVDARHQPRPRGPAQHLRTSCGRGEVDYLVLAAIERDSNSVREYDIDAALASRHAQARRVHRGHPRPCSRSSTRGRPC